VKFGEFGGIQGRVVSAVPIRGQPLQADWEEVHTKKATGERRRAWGRCYRSSQGLVRGEVTIEAFLPDGRNFTVTTVSDPTRLIAKVIHSEADRPMVIDVGRYIRDHGICCVPGTQGATGSEAIDAPPRETELAACPVSQEGADAERTLPPAPEPLGKRFIEGIRCFGMREVCDQGTLEMWLAEKLRATVVLGTYQSPEFEVVYRLFNIHLVEPDPALFEAVDSITSVD
jgi:hypothetical protein